MTATTDYFLAQSKREILFKLRKVEKDAADLSDALSQISKYAKKSADNDLARFYPSGLDGHCGNGAALDLEIERIAVLFEKYQELTTLLHESVDSLA